MKKVFLTLVAAMAMSYATAQEMPSRDNDRTEMMTRELDLTPEQAEKVKALNDKYPELMRFNRGGHRPGGRPGDGPRPNRDQKVDGTTGATAQQPQQPQQMQRPSREEMEKRMQERRKQREAYEAELKTILTEEQFEKYEKSKPQPRGPRPGFGGPRQ